MFISVSTTKLSCPHTLDQPYILAPQEVLWSQGMKFKSMARIFKSIDNIGNGCFQAECAEEADPLHSLWGISSFKGHLIANCSF